MFWLCDIIQILEIWLLSLSRKPVEKRKTPFHCFTQVTYNLECIQFQVNPQNRLSQQGVKFCLKINVIFSKVQFTFTIAAPTLCWHCCCSSFRQLKVKSEPDTWCKWCLQLSVPWVDMPVYCLSTTKAQSRCWMDGVALHKQCTIQHWWPSKDWVIHTRPWSMCLYAWVWVTLTVENRREIQYTTPTTEMRYSH